jgi:hypothetical protein
LQRDEQQARSATLAHSAHQQLSQQRSTSTFDALLLKDLDRRNREERRSQPVRLATFLNSKWLDELLLFQPHDCAIERARPSRAPLILSISSIMA